MMKKPVDYPVLELIKKRWSPYVFATTPVEDEKLRILFEAARWAPSSYNEQPWAFILGIEPEAHAKILSCLVEFNQEWAGPVPVIGISVAKLNFEKNGKPNRHAMHDVGSAMGMLCLQATELGLCVHQMAGFDVDKAKKVCKIPDGWEPAAAFAIGYPGDPKKAQADLADKDKEPRPRKPVPLYQGEWKVKF